MSAVHSICIVRYAVRLILHKLEQPGVLQAVS
jgi:hypothetical protein